MSWLSILGYTAAGGALGASLNAVLASAFGAENVLDLFKEAAAAPHEVLQQFVNHPSALESLGGYISTNAPTVVEGDIHNLGSKALISNMGLGEIRMHASTEGYDDAVKLITNHFSGENYQVDYSKAYEQLRQLANDVPGVTFVENPKEFARTGDLVLALNDTNKGHLVLPQEIRDVESRMFGQAFFGTDISESDLIRLYVATHQGDEVSILKSAAHGAASGGIAGGLFGTVKHFSERDISQPLVPQNNQEEANWRERIAAENVQTPQTPTRI